MTGYQQLLQKLPRQIREEIWFCAERFLPLHELEDGTVRLRDAKQVAERALVLGIVATAAMEPSDMDPVLWLTERDLWDATTEAERDFLLRGAGDKKLAASLSWRAESIFVLLWALKLVPELGAPVAECDLGELSTLLPTEQHAVTRFIEAATLRSSDEIMDALCVLWQIRSAIMNYLITNYGKSVGNPPIVVIDASAKAPAGLHAVVAREWHHAFNWLTCYCNQDWDDISADT